jgi:transposase
LASLYVKEVPLREGSHVTKEVLQRSKLYESNFSIMKTIQPSARKGNQDQKLQNPVDFSFRDLYVGIDIHKVRWQVAVLFDGIVLSNTSIEASASGLIHHLHKFYSGAKFHCVYESGPFGFGLCRALCSAGMECIVVNPADIPDTHKEKRNKTDPVDARKLARHLAAGLLHAIHIPPEKLQKQRSLIRFRKKLWSDLVRSKNRLKSELLFQGIIIPKQYDNPHWSHNFLNWIEQQALKDEYLRDTLLLMLEEAKLLRQLLLKTERKIREMMWSDDFVQNSGLLRSVAGVGPLTSMLFLLEVGDVRRFKSFDALNRFVGFCPDSRSSGETQRHTGLSLRKHNQLRTMLVEASWQLIRRDTAMLDYYRDLTKRMKGQEAIIRVARKLLRRIRAVLLCEKMYVNGIDGRHVCSDIDAPCLTESKRKATR